MKSSIAKLTRPRVERIVERSRLLTRLDHAEDKIVWISAPAGSGKTTLVAHWLETRKYATLWYQADEGDRDIASFFSYLGRAVKLAAPRYRTPLPLLTSEYRQSLPIFTKRFFEELFRRLAVSGAARAKPRNFVIVIDNYQDVPLDSQFHEVVRSALEHAPEGIALVVISRTDPPPVFARLQANNKVEVLGREEIWFTFEESQSLARLHEKTPLPVHTLKMLYEKTHGWAAGLVLLMGKGSLADECGGLRDIPRERIFDYFASELFDCVDAETQGFLLVSAFLPRMSAAAAAELTGHDHAGRILNQLSRNNFFIQRHATPELVFQYHPLFREFLQKHAHEYFSSQENVKIKKKAAALLAKAGQHEAAADIMIEIEDWNSLTTLILQDAKSLLHEGRLLTLGTWIQSIPEDRVAHNGWLLYWNAMCRLSTRPAEARTKLEKAFALFLAEGDPEGSFLSWAGIVDTFMYEWKDFHPLDRWIEEFSALFDRYSVYPSKAVQERSTSAMFAALMFRQPHHPDLAEWEKQVRDIMMETADLSHRVFIGYNLLLYCLWTGRVNEAGELVSMLSPVMQDAKAAALPKLMCLRAMALYHVYSCEPEAGLKNVAQGLTLADETGVHLVDLSFFGVAIYHATMLGDTVLARNFLSRMTAGYSRESCYAKIYHASQSALVAMLQGRFDIAIARAETSVKLSCEAGVPLLVNAHETSLAIIFATARHYDKLPPLLAGLRNRAALTKSAQVGVWCACIEAQTALDDRDDVRFAAQFRIAVDVCKRTGLRLLTWLPATLARICVKALELDMEANFVQEIIRLNKLTPDSTATVPDTWPYPLKIRTLGGFGLFQDDRPMLFSGKVQQKPLAMLKAVIALGCRDVEDKALTDALWPEAEGDQGRRSFDTTLHRLRKLLPDERLIQLQDGKVTLDERYCWVDTRAFERLLCTVEENWTGFQAERTPGTRQETLRFAERAIRMYRGHFFPTENGESWAITLRERLRIKYMGAVNRLGKYYMTTGDFEKSVDLFQRALEIEDLSEGFYQNLMRSYLKLGCKAEAATTYKRCQNILSSKLGLTPSETTDEMYHMVKA